MTALRTRQDELSVDLATPAAGPLDGLVSDAREVAVALTALQAHNRRRAVRIPAQAFHVVEDLGSYGA